MMRFSPTTERFVLTEDELFARSIPEPNTGCWLWLGAYKANGYARFKNRPVGRSFFRLTDPKQHVLHHCDQPACVNPDHWYIGTQAQNMTDKARRGRASYGFGNRNAAKLTPEMVTAIREDPRTQRVIAAEYGVTQAAISLYKKGGDRA